MGGTQIVEEPAFALFDICGFHIGIGSVGTTFIEPGNEYPHIGLEVDAGALVHMKECLSACGIPSSPFWTRAGVETMMFFRDPSGNVIELYCHEGYADAPNLPRGPAQGHGNAIDIDEIRYDAWSLPA